VLYGFGGACGLVGWSCNWIPLRLVGWVVFCLLFDLFGGIMGGDLVGLIKIIKGTYKTK
jgi:hypothetical protein